MTKTSSPFFFVTTDGPDFVDGRPAPAISRSASRSDKQSVTDSEEGRSTGGAGPEVVKTELLGQARDIDERVSCCQW